MSEHVEVLKFRKKPVVVEAVQYPCEHPALKRCDCDPNWPHNEGPAPPQACSECGHEFIETLEGRMRVSPGDWIIRGVQGEHYPCKPDIFAATYEPANAAIAALSAPAEAQPVAYSRAPVDGRLNPITPREYAWLRESGGGEGFRPLVYGDTTPPAESQSVCTCPSGDGSLRWPYPEHPPAGDAVLRTAVEYHYAQAALPCDQFGNTSHHPNPKLQAWHKQVADALSAQQPSSSASQVYAHKFATTLQSAAVGEVAILDAKRVEAIKRMRFGVVPVEGGGWDVYVYDADGGKETLISSAKDVRHAIDEAIAAQQGGRDDE